MQRRQLNAFLAATRHALDAEEESSSSSSLSTSSISSNGSNTDTLQSTIGYLWQTTKNFAQRIYMPLEDPRINWHQQHCLIDIFTNSACHKYFRFAKDNLKKLATLLWPRMSPYLDRTPCHIKCKNWYICHYETGLLVVLFCLSWPTQI